MNVNVTLEGDANSGLTHLARRDASFFPTWSPDGRITFEVQSHDYDEVYGNREIYVMNADGTGETRLTNNPANDSNPTWSPDGKYLAFTSDRDGQSEIYVMNVEEMLQGDEDKAVIRLTNHPAHDRKPAWSPDGTRIAFTSDRHGSNGIYIIHVKDTPQGIEVSEPTRLIYSRHYYWAPAWSPDSKRIVFSSTQDGNQEIYIMNADGSGMMTRLTNHPAEDMWPSWGR
jgi:Tol biopolymer transport system component